MAHNPYKQISPEIHTPTHTHNNQYSSVNMSLGTFKFWSKIVKVPKKMFNNCDNYQFDNNHRKNGYGNGKMVLKEQNE